MGVFEVAICALKLDDDDDVKRMTRTDFLYYNVILLSKI